VGSVTECENHSALESPDRGTDRDRCSDLTIVKVVSSQTLLLLAARSDSFMFSRPRFLSYRWRINLRPQWQKVTVTRWTKCTSLIPQIPPVVYPWFDTSWLSPNRFNYEDLFALFSKSRQALEDPPLIGLMASAWVWGLRRFKSRGYENPHARKQANRWRMCWHLARRASLTPACATRPTQSPSDPPKAKCWLTKAKSLLTLFQFHSSCLPPFISFHRLYSLLVFHICLHLYFCFHKGVLPQLAICFFGILFLLNQFKAQFIKCEDILRKKCRSQFLKVQSHVPKSLV